MTNAREHYKIHVLPIYEDQGLCPEFADAVGRHVAQYGAYQVWNHHGEADGSDPHWFDRENNCVKPLKLAYVVA